MIFTQEAECAVLPSLIALFSVHRLGCLLHVLARAGLTVNALKSAILYRFKGVFAKTTKSTCRCDPAPEHAQIASASSVLFVPSLLPVGACAMTLLALVLAALAVVQSRAGGPKFVATVGTCLGVREATLCRHCYIA